MKRLAFVPGLLLLASCGGAAAPSATPSSPAAPASAAPASAAGPASAKPASAKPAASGAAAAKPQAKLTIAAPSTTLTLSPTLIADKKGFFAEQGLNVELVYAGSGSKAAAAVVGGSAQVGASDLGDLLGAVEGGQDIRVFAAIGVEPVYVTVLRRNVAEKLNLGEKMPIEQRMKAVKGLKFAISTPGSGTDSMLHYLLSLGGLDPERDVQILTTGAVVNSYAAAAQGSADGASLSPPTGEQALVKDNMFPLMNTAAGDLPQLNGQLQNGLWATGKWLDSNPQLAAAATAAMWKTYDYIKQNPQEAAELVHKEAWESTEQRVYDLAWKDATPSFPTTPAVSMAGLQKLLEFTKVTQKKDFKITPEKAIDPKPVEAAKTLLGR
jgi:NitT/TauT family transport system substrate-binding protein